MYSCDQFELDLKSNLSAEYDYMNIYGLAPHAPINVIVTALAWECM